MVHQSPQPDDDGLDPQVDLDALLSEIKQQVPEPASDRPDAPQTPKAAEPSDTTGIPPCGPEPGSPGTSGTPEPDSNPDAACPRERAPSNKPADDASDLLSAIDQATAPSPSEYLVDQELRNALEAAAADSEPPSNDAAPDPVAQAEKPSEPVGETDLADQIQSLLDEAKDQPNPHASQTPEPAESPGPPDPPMTDGSDEQWGDFYAPDDATIAAAAQAISAEPAAGTKPPAPTSQTKSDQDLAAPATAARIEDSTGAEASIDQLDDLLAESANHAVEGDFETIDQVLEPTTDHPVPERDPSPGEDELAGTFETPEHLSVDSTIEAELSGAAAGGDAPQGAVEAEPVAAPVGVEDAVQAEDADPTPGTGSPRGRLDKAMVNVHHICVVINRPLNRLSPEMRNVIGFIGLFNVFAALCLIFIAILF